MNHLISITISFLLGTVGQVAPIPTDAKAKSVPTPIADGKFDLKEPVVFDRHAFPILAEKCLVCHDADGGLAEGKLDLTTAAAVLKGGKRGPAIVVGKSSTSWLYRLSSHREKPVMPPVKSPPLTPRELAVLKAWIDQGAKPGDDPTPAKTLEKESVVGPPNQSVKSVFAVAFSADAKQLAVGRGGVVEIVDLIGKKIVQKLDGQQDVVQSLRFRPDGKQLAVGSYKLVVLYGPEQSRWIESARLETPAGRVAALDYSPDGKLLAVAACMPTAPADIAFYKSDDGKLARSIADAHSDAILGLAFSKDGSKLASCSADKFVRVHDSATGKRLHTFEGHVDHVMGVAWNLDNSAVYAGAGDSQLRSWSLKTNEPLRTMGGHPRAITGLVAIPKTNHGLTSCADGSVRRMDFGGGEVRNFGGTGDWLQCVAVSQDGKLLAAGGQNGTLVVFEVESGKRVEWETVKK